MTHSHLLSSWQQNRLSHAYLLSGIAGLGKTAFATEFATFLLCENNNKTSSACQQCRSCGWMQSQTHPDFILITPPEKSHAIKIDQIREMNEKISQTAHSGGYQVVVISPADNMPMGSANALLKTLEEPTGNVIIFLIDNQEHVLPATIQSRCQTLFFDDEMAIKDMLQKKEIKLRDDILNHLDLLSEHRVNPIVPVTTWIKNETTVVLKILLLLCVDISRLQFQATSILNDDRYEKLSQIAKRILPIKLQEFIQKINNKKLLLSRGFNLNAQLCLEDVFIEFEKIM